jgi:anti-sigma B factor antagonist
MLVEFAFRQVDPGITVMEFKGDLSIPGITVAEVERAIKKRLEKGCRKLVLDLGKVGFLDSSGVGLLAACSGDMERLGGKVAIAGASGHVKKVLEIVHLDRILGMYSDLASACQSMPETTAPPPAAS